MSILSFWDALAIATRYVYSQLLELFFEGHLFLGYIFHDPLFINSKKEVFNPLFVL